MIRNKVERTEYVINAPGEYGLVSLIGGGRFGKATMPEVVLIDDTRDRPYRSLL